MREQDAGTTRLVIVESPAKAKTISGYLGPGYVVEASFGHIRDLPRNAADVPAEVQGRAVGASSASTSTTASRRSTWSPPTRRQQVSKLKKLPKEVDEIFLATDEDREGEAIAWHLVETLKPKVPVKRMVFHEITKPAIQAAVANPREIDRDLVDAQEARRILDRLYGYEVSPVLWKKVMPRLSAGRVQSVATRIVVERERRADGVPHRRILGHPGRPRHRRTPGEGPRTFNATLVALDGDRIATGSDFEPTTGRCAPGAGVVHLDEGGGPRARRRPGGPRRSRSPGSRRSPTAAARTRRSCTSTLQQEAARKLRLSSAADDAHRAAAVRERLHHLHAYRLGRTCRRRPSRPPAGRSSSCTARERAAGAAPLRPAR